MDEAQPVAISGEAAFQRLDGGLVARRVVSNRSDAQRVGTAHAAINPRVGVEHNIDQHRAGRRHQFLNEADNAPLLLIVADLNRDRVANLRARHFILEIGAKHNRAVVTRQQPTAFGHTGRKHRRGGRHCADVHRVAGAAVGAHREGRIAQQRLDAGGVGYREGGGSHLRHAVGATELHFDIVTLRGDAVV